MAFMEKMMEKMMKEMGNAPMMKMMQQMCEKMQKEEFKPWQFCERIEKSLQELIKINKQILEELRKNK